MVLELLAIGALSLLVQVALLREVAVASYGNELAWVAALGLWMAGTALGALVGRRGPGVVAVRPLFVATAGLLPAALLWMRASRPLLGAGPGAYLSIPRQIVAIALALLPAAMAFGQLFRRAAQRGGESGRSLASAYAIESVGALLGGAASMVAFRHGIATSAVLLACAWATAAIGRAPRLLLAVGLAIVVAAVLLPGFDLVTTGWTHRGVVAVRDSPYGRTAISRWDGQLNVFVDDALAYETAGTAAEEFVALAALQHPAPARVLILEGGSIGLVGEVLRHRALRVDSVELDSATRGLLRALLPDSMRAPLVAPQVHEYLGDARQFLARLPVDADPYDLILVGASEPSSGRANRFYTAEFFEVCAAHLAADGVLALHLPAAENLWSPSMARRMASIDQALRGSFPQVLVLPGQDCVVLASRAGLTRDPALLAARLHERGAAGRIVSPAWLAYVLGNDRVDATAALLAAEPAEANRDLRPVCYRYSLMLWLEQFDVRPGRDRLPKAAVRRAVQAVQQRVFGGPSGRRALWMLGLAAGFVGLRWWLRRPAARAVVIVAGAGAVAMLMESLLLLAYQSANGVLFQDLGAVLMAFMAGLALGAYACRAAADRRRGLGALVALCAVAATTAFGMRAGVEWSLWLTAADLFVVGVGAGGAFACAAGMLQDAPRAARRLYGADLLGGCVGAVVGGLVLLPLSGLPATALVAAALAAMAALWA